MGEVDLAAGTPIPWSTAVVVDLGAGAGRKEAGAEAKRQGKSPGKVHVHLMEGVDRVASYVIDLAPPVPPGGVAPGAKRVGAGFFGGWGAGAPSNPAAGRGVPSRLKFFFRVDDGGVPSVQSAR